VPMARLANKYGLSDVGLAKICKKNGIPRPGRGYWARMQARQKVQRITLPKKDIDCTIEIRANPFHDLGPEQKEIAMKEASLAKQRKERIVVPETLRNSHPLVKQSAEVLKSSEPNINGIIEPSNREDCLHIWVTKKNLSRALRIMDSLVKALEDGGYQVSLAAKATQVAISDISLSIGISEELKHKRLEPKNHNLDGYYRFGYNRYEEKPSPTGDLCLWIGDPGFYTGGICRLSWRDGKSQRVENCLSKFVSGLLKVAALKREHLRRELEKQKEGHE
jgi:hypothetical protein